MSPSSRLPQLDGGLFLTDGGLETTLIFHRGIDLPLFASFTLLGDPEGERALRDYFEPYLALAAAGDAGFILDTATWRASPRWAEELGYSPEQLDRLNRRAVELCEELRSEHESRIAAPIVISGVHRARRTTAISPAELLSADAGRRVPRDPDHDLRRHRGGPDLRDHDDLRRRGDRGHPRRRGGRMPAVISFTVETDGRLPSGQDLGEAIEQVDAETDSAPRLLHDQLRAPDPLRRGPRCGRTMGASGSGACGRTPRP